MNRISITLLLLITAFFLLSNNQISAKDESTDWLVGYNGGYIQPIGIYKNDFEPSISYGGLFIYLTGWYGLFFESNLSYNSFRISNAGDSTLSQYITTIGPGFLFPLTGWLEPYLSLQGGINYMQFEYDATQKSSGSIKPYGTAAVGIQISPFDYFSFRIGGGLGLSEISGDMHTSYMITGAFLMRTSVFSERNILEKKESQARITFLKLKPVFGARYTSYGVEGIGNAVIKNTGDEALTDIYIETLISEIRSGPTKTEIIKELLPGESAELELPIMISKEIMSLNDSRDIPARFRTFYKNSKGVYSYIEVRNVIVHSKNALTWDDTAHLGSFITPKNEAVISFSKRAISLFKNSFLPGYNKKIQAAMTIFDAIGAAGIVYVRDPNSAPNQNSLDYVMFPDETMAKKAGDCDDLTVLLASLLESVEISTAIVTVPGHVFLMFDTGVPAHSASDITADNSLIYKYNGTIWIPIEATMTGKSFIEAWKQGASTINRNSSNINDFEILESSLAWKKYPSTDIGNKADVLKPDYEKIKILFLLDKDYLRTMGFDEASSKLKTIIENSPDDYQALNRMGILHAKYVNIDEAMEWFKKAIKLNPAYVPAYSNIGNIYFFIKKFNDSIEAFGKALQLEPENHKNKINLARAYFEEGKLFKAKELYQDALKDAPGYAKLYGYLDSDPSIRASDPEERTGYNMWQEDF